MNKEKYNVIDLFCGCGGLSKGFELAGYNVLGGIDINQSAINTYNKNFQNSKGVCANLLDVSEEDILREYQDFLKADIIIGGPPCQGFSTANRYKKEEDDERNKLFFEFLKFVDLIKPSVILIENVRGIVTMNKGQAKKRIYELFEKRGYYVNHKVLNSAEYGVPQKRMRNFFVMTKQKKFNFDEVKKIDAPTVYDTISELYGFEKKVCEEGVYKLEKAPKNNYEKYLRSENNKIYNHIIKYPADFVQYRMSFVPQGGNWKNVPVELFPTQRTNRHSSAYRRLEENKVSVTIDTGNNHCNYYHPLYNRIPTVREAARIQSFPDNFIFTGTRSEQYRQVGNAVPPRLAYALGNTIKEYI